MPILQGLSVCQSIIFELFMTLHKFFHGFMLKITPDLFYFFVQNLSKQRLCSTSPPSLPAFDFPPPSIYDFSNSFFRFLFFCIHGYQSFTNVHKRIFIFPSISTKLFYFALNFLSHCPAGCLFLLKCTYFPCSALDKL